MAIVIYKDPKSEMFNSEFNRYDLEDWRAACRLLLNLDIDGQLKEFVESFGSSIDRVLKTVEGTLMTATDQP
jgi:hypothetical protein